jgi:tetratricopeptide (TPR) repeat protein
MQKALMIGILALAVWLTISVGRYWWADYCYAHGRYEEAVKLSPKEPLYRVALERPQEIERAVAMSPRNIKLLEMAAQAYLDLGEEDKTYFLEAIKIQERLIELAPTYAKFYYNLGVSYLQVGNTNKGKEMLTRAVALKPDYEKAEKLLGIIRQKR